MRKPVLRLDCVNRVRCDKNTLLRIVRTPQGTIEVDPSGHLNGHGVYLTPDAATLEKAEKTNALERALQAKIPAEVYAKIGRYIK